MIEPIEANYVPDGDDWTITIVGRGKTLTATAPGLIAARDRADQMVDELAGDEKNRTVVHRLDGDALEFTTAYLNARLAKPQHVDELADDKAAATAPDTENATAEKDKPERARPTERASPAKASSAKDGAAPADAGKTAGDEPAEAATGS
ncbi:hypothetical protein ALI144C_21220 [Actinosynnema sp. ALI-1.44]|uniref:hypothetical protein n=1 Tax=Actinosynnema sp. ALI-1.44 TaxID=1933779 RepID=UPI00097C10A0|nr:hypothetical protein [Actinosynnema sp. ALI-1.44]ONI81076.1 hypothetical protein ALI144C_21220 [Actinosynnema sp. ALI-1.44]